MCIKANWKYMFCYFWRVLCLETSFTLHILESNVFVTNKSTLAFIQFSILVRSVDKTAHNNFKVIQPLLISILYFNSSNKVSCKDKRKPRAIINFLLIIKTKKCTHKQFYCHCILPRIIKLWKAQWGSIFWCNNTMYSLTTNTLNTFINCQYL